MKLCFERTIRNALYPVIRRKNHHIQNPYKTAKFHLESTMSKPFNFSVPHLLMINVLHDLRCKAIFSANDNFVPRTIQDEFIYRYIQVLNPDEIEMRYDSFIYNIASQQPPTPKPGQILYSTILDRYPFIGDLMTAARMLEVFRQIDSCKFGMILEPRFLNRIEIQTRTGKTTRTQSRKGLLNTVTKSASKLFTLQVDKNDLMQDGRGLKDVRFKFDFRHFYELLTLEGIRTINIDWIPEEIYTSKVSEYAKLFYIFFLVGKRQPKPVKLQAIIERLGLTDSRTDQADKTVQCILNRLKTAGFVEDYKILGKIQNRAFEVMPSKM